MPKPLKPAPVMEADKTPPEGARAPSGAERGRGTLRRPPQLVAGPTVAWLREQLGDAAAGVLETADGFYLHVAAGDGARVVLAIDSATRAGTAGARESFAKRVQLQLAGVK